MDKRNPFNQLTLSPERLPIFIKFVAHSGIVKEYVIKATSNGEKICINKAEPEIRNNK